MSNVNDKVEEYFSKVRELKAKYPDYHDASPVKTLNLIMKKEFAEQILKGEKKVEFRAFTQHYCDRLYDKDVTRFMDYHAKDSDALLEYADPLRVVETIHFHNYNNTWSLDVNCKANTLMVVNQENADYLREEYGCTDFDEVLNDLRVRRAKTSPIYFVFILGDVLESEGI